MSGKRGQTATVLAPFEQMTGKSYPSGRFSPFHLIASDWTMGVARAKYRHLPTRCRKEPLTFAVQISESVMRRTPELLIARLRNRKGRIIAYGVLSVIFLGVLINYWLLMTDAVDSLVPKEGDDLLLHVVTGQYMVLGIALMQTLFILLAMGLGFAATSLLNEISGCTKMDLVVELWDRVQALERSQAPAAKGQQPPSRGAPDQT